MYPQRIDGWQLVQITLAPKGKGDQQVDDLYIDPYRR